jgi:hypothetical protein
LGTKNQVVLAINNQHLDHTKAAKGEGGRFHADLARGCS